MSNFSAAVHVLMEHEGGYAPLDANGAGAVNFGVTERFVRDAKLSDNPAEFVRTMTPERARDIYKRFFWDEYHIGEINDERLATVLFSMAVNMGPGPAVRTLQLALNDIGQLVDVDGIFGPETRAAVNARPPEKIAAEWKRRLVERYRVIARRSGDGYLRGWLKRLDALFAPFNL